MNVPKPQPAADPRRTPVAEVRRPAAATATATRSAPPAPQTADPRKASDARKPASAPPPARPASAPAAVAADEDPEKLLRQYAEQQKSKVQRLEQQLVELRKVQAERDALRARSEALARELAEARKQLEAAAKADEIIRDLQAKVDAALLSSSMDKEELSKLRARSESLETGLKKTEDRAGHAEKSLAEAQRALASQTESRKEAESRISGALQALHGEAVSKTASVRVPSTEPPAGKPSEKAAVTPKPPLVAIRK